MYQTEERAQSAKLRGHAVIAKFQGHRVIIQTQTNQSCGLKYIKYDDKTGGCWMGVFTY